MLVKFFFFNFVFQVQKDSSKVVTLIYVFHYKHLSSPIEVDEITHILQAKCF